MHVPSSMRPLALALLLACRPDAAGPPPAADPSTAAAPASPAPPRPADDVIDADLDVMIGGNFAPDHLGPQAYDELLARALAYAEVYAQRLTARHEPRARSEPAYADLYVAATLARLHPRAPDRVALSARLFLGAFEALSQRPDLDDRRRLRLREQTAILGVLAGGIDRPDAPDATAVRPDRVCVVATPERHGLMPQRDCTCGERFACRIERRGDALELVTRQLPDPPICDDCYPGWTTCTLDRLSPGERVRVTVEGRELGSLTADASGRLPAGACLTPHARGRD